MSINELLYKLREFYVAHTPSRKEVKSSWGKFIKGQTPIWLHPVILVTGFIILFFIYGILEDLGLLNVISKHPSFMMNIVMMILLGGFGYLIFRWAIRIQSAFSRPRRFHNELTVLTVGAFLMPWITTIPKDIIYALAGVKPTVPTNQKIIDYSLTHSANGLLYMSIMMVIIGPIVEEILFRFMIIGPGALTTHNISHRVRATMIVLSNLLFVYGHIKAQLSLSAFTNYTAFIRLFAPTVDYLLIAVILTYVYVKTRDIRVAIGFHVGFNALVAILSLMFV